MQILNIANTKKLIKQCILANIPLHIQGSPGIGKSNIVEQVSKDLNLPCYVLLLSQIPQEEVGGIPVVIENKVHRMPLSAIREAVSKPCVLFLDELTCANSAVQGAAMRGVLEHIFGDAILHPDTRVILASNPPEQAAGGNELELPMINRLCHIRMVPDISEVRNFLANLGEEGSILRSIAMDFVLTSGSKPDLIQLDPPRADTHDQWASPRSIHRACTLLAVQTEGGDDSDSATVHAALCGNIGDAAAGTWLGLRKLRKDLASVDDVLKDPEKCKLPTNLDAAIASMSVMYEVVHKDFYAAYIWLERIFKAGSSGAGDDIWAALFNTIGWNAPNVSEQEKKNNRISPFKTRGMQSKMVIDRESTRLFNQSRK